MLFPNLEESTRLNSTLKGKYRNIYSNFFGSFHSVICMQLKVHLEILKQKDIFMVDRSSNVLSNDVFIESKIDV